MYISYIYSCFSPYLHLRISVLPPLSSTRLRQKLISPDICFQSKASSLLFPLCRLSIKRINLCAGKDHKRISLCLFSVSDSALSFFLSGCMCLSFCLYISRLRWFTLSTAIQLCLVLLCYFLVEHTALQKVVGVRRLIGCPYVGSIWIFTTPHVALAVAMSRQSQLGGIPGISRFPYTMNRGGFFHQSVRVQWASAMSPQSLYPNHLLFACFCTFSLCPFFWKWIGAEVAVFAALQPKYIMTLFNRILKRIWQFWLLLNCPKILWPISLWSSSSLYHGDIIKGVVASLATTSCRD